jgi:hypothetical protein
MYTFQVFPIDDDTDCISSGGPVRTFQDENVDKAFEEAREWVHKMYGQHWDPDYAIVSHFGILRP